VATPSLAYSGLYQCLAELPPFPTTALRLLMLSTESSTAIEDFENAFKSDPALATELLMAANSAEFGLRARVESIRRAITLLGLERVNELSVAIAMRSYIRGGPRMRVMQPLWLHSIATAVIAETLGTITGLATPALYTAGLVHDIGRLGLLTTLGSQYAKMLAPPTMTLHEANGLERELFGIDHTEAGAVMVQKWNFPEPLCHAVRHHHHGTDGGDESLQHVQLACRLAGALGYDEHTGLARPSLGGVLLDLPGSLRGHEALQPEHLLNRITRLPQQLSGR
jgi:putative nucleotidyltransferase with HDIG domain